MTFRQRLMYSVPMRSILIATREHFRGFDKYHADLAAYRMMVTETAGHA